MMYLYQVLSLFSQRYFIWAAVYELVVVDLLDLSARRLCCSGLVSNLAIQDCRKHTVIPASSIINNSACSV